MSKRIKRQQKPKKVKTYLGKKCPFCGTHLRESEIWDPTTQLIHRSVDCPECGRYSDVIV